MGEDDICCVLDFGCDKVGIRLYINKVNNKIFILVFYMNKRKLFYSVGERVKLSIGINK